MINDNQKLFPNFSSFDRAISYPYFAPNYSFSFHKGKFIKGICDDLNNRIPIFWDDMYLKHGGVWMVTRNTKLSKEKVDSIWIKNEKKLTEYLDDFPKNCIYM